ncbi:MAG: hypothetical protein VX644_08235, partial [Planctomycetota bacterium]|nr:hypothetical protein [Planctomycetota bacterium]
MNSDHPPLPLEVALEIERICSDYESAWQAQQAPRLEDSLQRIQAAYQPALLFELLLLEFNYCPG